MRSTLGKVKKLAVIAAVSVAAAYLVRSLLTPVPEVRFFPPGAEAALRRAGIATDRVGRQLLNITDPLSADTHRQSGTWHGMPYANALDIQPADTATQRRREIHLLRMAGFAAWSRGLGEPGGAPNLAPHYHAVWTGASTDLPDNRQQICSFVRHLKGLSHFNRAEGRRRTQVEMTDGTVTHNEVLAVARRYGSVKSNENHPLDACRTYEQAH